MEDSDCQPMMKDPDLKSYVGSKIILAKPMHESEWLKMKNQESPALRGPLLNGYLVIYDNGYQAWSPKEAFEDSYRELRHSEKSIVTF